MVSEEQGQGEEVLSGNEKGIYTLTSSDLETIHDIEKMKTAYLMNLEGMTGYTRMEQLSNLLTNMQILMEKYNFGEYLKKTMVDGYSFYYVRDSVKDTDGDIEFMRLGCSIAFTVWENVLKLLGVGIPTYRSSVKKKIIDSLFSLASSEIDEGKIINGFDGYDYKSAVDGRFLSHTKFDFFWYCVSHMKDYDLDFNMVCVGKARSSKSTAMLHGVDSIYSYREREFDFRNWVDTRAIYDTKSGSEAIRSSNEDVNLFDETYRTHDRRRSMSKGQVGLTGDANFYASKKSINLLLIQNFSDMDLRGTTKANAVLLVVERGRGLLFADARYIPLAKDQFGFESLIQSPEVLKYAPMAIHMLKRSSSYVCELNWDRYDDSSAFYSYYLANKEKQQEKLAVVQTVKTRSETKVADMIRNMVNGGMKQIDVAKAIGKTRQYVHDVVTQPTPAQ